MMPIGYARAEDVTDAIRLASGTDGAKYLGGGTNLVDLMRETVERPRLLVDVSRLSGQIESTADGGLLIGAGATNTALAGHPVVRSRFPLLARAVLSGASGQIRNMATVGGNILQRTRCTYFYDEAARCNKREPGAGCDALEGANRIHAVLGTSAACVATHPSDLCVALAALDAEVHTEGPDGRRTIRFVDLHRLPGDHPDRETVLAPHELITAVQLAPLPSRARSTYRKVRDRASYAFALVSVAAAVELGDDGGIRDVRVAWGGLASKPWRARQAEQILAGRQPSPELFGSAADAELAGARPLRDNAFKVDLARRTTVAVLTELTRPAGTASDAGQRGGRP